MPTLPGSLRAAFLGAEVLAILLALRAATFADEAFDVEGDPELLKLLLAAQNTNASAFPEGELKANVRFARSKGKALEELQAHVAWQGERTWWDYDLTEVVAEREKQRELGRIIETPQSLATFFPESNLLQIYWAERRSYNRLLNLRPDRRWFSTGTDYGFSKLLDVLDVGAPGRRGQAAVRVWKEADDTIVVERIAEAGGKMRMTASLAMDGNIVAYECELTSTSTIDENGRLEWVRAPSGRWRLSRYAFDIKYLRSGGAVHCELDITEFSEQLADAAIRFEIASLNVPQGTKVEEFTDKGRIKYKFGASADEFLVALERQVRDLRDNGFAAPPNE